MVISLAYCIFLIYTFAKYDLYTTLVLKTAKATFSTPVNYSEDGPAVTEIVNEGMSK